MNPEKHCQCGCGRILTSRRSTRKYFDNECRQRAYRRRQATHKSFELVNTRKKVAGDLMRLGLIPEGEDSASIYEYVAQRRPRGRGGAAKARTRQAPETLEAYQRRKEGTGDFWRFSSGIFDSQTVSPKWQQIPGAKKRRKFGESKPPPGVRLGPIPWSRRNDALTVTAPISDRTISVNTPTIAERLTRLEMSSARQEASQARLETSVAQGLELTRRIAEQLGLPADDARVQEAVDAFLDSLD